jgi:hypothetical protein
MLKLNRFATTWQHGLIALATGCTIIVTTFCNTTLAQNVSTIAGNNNLLGFAGDGSPASAANVLLQLPQAVLARADGSVLIADRSNNRVRKIDVGGVITTFAGAGGANFSGDGGLAINAEIREPASLAEDTAGNIYIGSTGAIRKVTPAGIITTIVGDGIQALSSGDGGLATAARLSLVWGMAFDSTGNLFFSDPDGGTVRKIDTNGMITKIAGNAANTNAAFGQDNVAALGEPLNRPVGILVQTDGSLIVAVALQHRVRKIIPGGNITTIAGAGAATSTGDNGLATVATLNRPYGLAPDGAGGYFVAEFTGHRVRKVAANGMITTVIGSPTVLAGSPGAATNTGDGAAAEAATIRSPAGLSRDSVGNLLITSYNGHVIRKITAPPPVIPGPSIFNAYVNTTSATLGTITPAGEQSVPFGGIVMMTVTPNPRHIHRVSSNCIVTQTNQPVAFVPNGTGINIYAVTVTGPCQMEATFTPLIPKANVAIDATANALFATTERMQTYTPPAAGMQSTSTVGKSVTFKAWVTDIAGVPYPSASNVITFKANGASITGCSNVPLTLRASNVIHIREAVCVTSFAAVGNSVITSEFASDTYNFPAASSGLNHSVSAAP